MPLSLVNDHRSAILLLLLLMTIISIPIPSRAEGDSTDWKARFEAEYEQAARKLENGAWEFQMLSKKTLYRKGKAHQTWFLSQFTNGNRNRFESVRNNEADEGFTVVVLFTPRQHFRIYREGANGSFQRTSLNDDSRKAAVTSVRLTHPLACATHCVFELELLDLIKRERFEITKVEEVKRDGQTLVKFHWQIPGFLPNVPDKGSTTGGWFLLSPDEQWLLHEQFYCFRLDQNPEEGFHFVVKYDDVPNQRLPVPIEVSRSFLSKDGEMLQEKTELTELIELPPPDEMFELSSFGLE